MEAPEKIYLQQNTTTDCYEEWWPEWFEARAKDTDIEYTRTNAAWKPADEDNLPEIDREVIALVEEQGLCKVVFAHRPNPNGDAICFDKGGWNMPDIRYWLDLELPKMEE